MGFHLQVKIFHSHVGREKKNKFCRLKISEPAKLVRLFFVLESFGGKATSERLLRQAKDRRQCMLNRWHFIHEPAIWGREWGCQGMVGNLSRVIKVYQKM